MRPGQWDHFKRAARGEPLDRIPLALIADSPWIPGFLGIDHLDYYLDPECWFQANSRISEMFPDIIFVPSWWVEYGMAAEPSVLGARVRFSANQPPDVLPGLARLDDLDDLAGFDVETDGFAALTLHRIAGHRPRIEAAGHVLPMITARGPLCTAGFLRGATTFMMDLLDDPAGAHRLLDVCTEVVIRWLQAQHAVLGDAVEGLLLLDDLVGFIGEAAYLEFAHPRLKRICDAFPEEWVKVYHNDAGIEACLEHLPDAGFHVLNWGKQSPIAEVRARVGGRLCLMGNVNPLEIGVRGTPEDVRRAAREVLESAGGGGLILSLGGGISPGMPRENLLALQDALAADPGGRP